MKKFFTTLCIAIVSVIQLQAQVPQGFNYQATVRNSNGDLLVNTNVYFKLNIIQGSQTSIPVFTELHYLQTDDLGQINLVIGQGSPSVGSFLQIDWSLGSYYLGIELDIGSGYVAMGTTQLLSVPYALYAQNAGNGGSNNVNTPSLESVLTENNSANIQQIKDLQDPTEAQDAATKNYVDTEIENKTTSSGLLKGNTVGDMLYWNGSDWSEIAAPKKNSTLKFCDGQLTWSGCRPNIVIHKCILDNYDNGYCSAQVFYDLYPNGSIVSDIKLLLSQTNNLPDENDFVVFGWPQNNLNEGDTYSHSNELLICGVPIGTYYVRARVESNLGTSYSETIQVIIDQEVQCNPILTPDPEPPINEEEVITTLTVTLVPDGDGEEIVLSFQDLDGNGPDAPVITVSGDLAAGVTYNGSIELLNEIEDPAEDITEEVEELDLEHQVFYTVGTGLDVTTAYSNFDTDANPLGTEFTLTAGTVSSGTLTFTMRYNPNKPNTGLSDAGGETDIEVAFDIEVK